jgi:hypothetical protein
MYSRRGFFERLSNMAQDREVWRRKRVSELRALALEAAPLDWTDEQREETGRALELKLSYMTDEGLREPGIRKYVEGIVRTKEMFYAAQRAEDDYLRRVEEHPDLDYYHRSEEPND